MQSYYIKPKAFYDSFGDVQPSQPYIYAYGDRPVFEFSFLPNEIAEGDTLVFAIDNDMVFYDSAPENLLHSASCMVVVRHDVTAEEATAGKVQMRIETRTVKFRDVVNGKVRPVEVISGLYRRRGSDDINYVLLAMGRAMANGIIADYNALPEPITTDEYYTKGDIDGLLGAKADESALVAHTDNSDIHVTLQDKSTWDSKADIGDIGNATVTITQDGETRGSFSVNASENVTIDLTGGAQADWDETDTTSPSYIQHKPSVYTKTETDALMDAKADKATTYTKTETDGLLDAKADKVTTLAGYGITDAYTKGEVDAKVASVYRYKGTVSTYADLPSSGQEVGDVWNIEIADSTHGVKAGDNVAWTGSEWDVLAGEIDLSAYATKTELETKLDAPATGTVGQVLTKTEDGQEWADAPAGGGGEDTTDYLCFTADAANDTISLNKVGTPSTINLEYSTDKKTWTEYTWDGNNGAIITLANIGDSVYFRGNNSTFSTSTNNYYNFQFSALTRASGNIMSLLDKTCESVTIPTDYCFNTLFGNTSKLKTPPKLPALYLKAWCYYYMFRSSGIVVAPELPAVTMKESCYLSMFEDSRSLTIAPELPATTLASQCYSSMFNNSYLLTCAPSILPATTLASQCYSSMFEWCQKLKTAPILPATTLVERCYGRMFYACKSLKGTIEIMATNLANACMTLMIPSGVEKVKVHFTDFGDYTTNWMGSSGANGIFECPSALDCSTRDASRVPAGWTIVRTDAPKSITSPTTASSEATYQVSPNTPSVPVVTVASALTLNASTVDSGSVAYSEIVLDVASGATVTAGTNLTLVDTPTAGKRNICVVRWSNGVAKMYVTIVEDLPQA